VGAKECRNNTTKSVLCHSMRVLPASVLQKHTSRVTTLIRSCFVSFFLRNATSPCEHAPSGTGCGRGTLTPSVWRACNDKLRSCKARRCAARQLGDHGIVPRLSDPPREVATQSCPWRTVPTRLASLTLEASRQICVERYSVDTGRRHFPRAKRGTGNGRTRAPTISPCLQTGLCSNPSSARLQLWKCRPS
jgi:hypothetical protein